MALVAPQPSTPQTPNKPTSGITYGAANQKKGDGEYDGELWRRLDLLWRGGWAIMKHAKEFIEKAPRENRKYYEWRCKVTSYVNYLARLVGFLAGSLFNETLNVGAGMVEGTNTPKPLPDPKFYSEFGADCDKRGTDFSQFMRAEVLVKAMVFRRAIIQVELPVADPDIAQEVTTLAEEDGLELRRAYLIPLDIDSLFNWHKDAFGRFVWCVFHRIHRDISAPFASQGKYQHEFKVWTIQDGRAHHALLRTKLVSNDNELRDEDELELVYPPRATSFRQIPIREFELPEALWVGNQAGPLCQEHFRRRSDLMGSLCRSLVELRVVKLGPEIPAVHGALPSAVQQDPNRGGDVVGQHDEEGQITLGAEDEVEYVGPTGAGHQIARDELKDTREEIFASVNAMALQLENSAAAVGRSGDSKKEDRSAMETVLTFMGDQVREFAQQLMTVVSEARGEKVEWVATGLSTFDNEDRGELVDEAVLMEPMRIPSPTWKRLYMKKLALATVPKASSDDKKKIADELDQNITEEEVTMDPFEKAKRLAQATEPPEPDGDEGAPRVKKPPPGKPKPGKPAKPPVGKK